MVGEGYRTGVELGVGARSTEIMAGRKAEREIHGQHASNFGVCWIARSMAIKAPRRYLFVLCLERDLFCVIMFWRFRRGVLNLPTTCPSFYIDIPIFIFSHTHLMIF